MPFAPKPVFSLDGHIFAEAWGRLYGGQDMETWMLSQFPARGVATVAVLTAGERKKRGAAAVPSLSNIEKAYDNGILNQKEEPFNQQLFGIMLEMAGWNHVATFPSRTHPREKEIRLYVK